MEIFNAQKHEKPSSALRFRIIFLRKYPRDQNTSLKLKVFLMPDID